MRSEAGKEGDSGFWCSDLGFGEETNDQANLLTPPRLKSSVDNRMTNLIAVVKR